MDATTAGTGQHDHHVFVQKFIGLAYSIKISIKITYSNTILTIQHAACFSMFQTGYSRPPGLRHTLDMSSMVRSSDLRLFCVFRTNRAPQTKIHDEYPTLSPFYWDICIYIYVYMHIKSLAECENFYWCWKHLLAGTKSKRENFSLIYKFSPSHNAL